MVVDDSNQLPKLVDRYEVVRAIGRGGMGVVYEAVHVDLRKRVAIKTLNADLAADQRYVARFLREGQAIARMRHPNVVEVFDIRAADGLVYLVMEYLEGETLEAFFRRESALDPARAIDLIIPVVAAVATAHDEGIVHRDLKPANVLLARGRTGITPKVLDFGISKLAEEPSDAPELTGSGVMLGTPLYMSPEQIESSRDVGPRSDQYALGVVLYRALTGHPPYAGANAFQVYRLAMQGKPTPPVQRVPSLPEALSDLVLRAMHRDHARRLPSVHELGARLLAFASPATRLQWEDVFGVMEFPLRRRCPRALRRGAAAHPRAAVATDLLRAAAAAHEPRPVVEALHRPRLRPGRRRGGRRGVSPRASCPTPPRARRGASPRPPSCARCR